MTVTYVDRASVYVKIVLTFQIKPLDSRRLLPEGLAFERSGGKQPDNSIAYALFAHTNTSKSYMR